MGVSKGNLVLKSILEKVYEVIPHSEVVSLKEKWLSLNNNNKIKWSNNEIAYLKKEKKNLLCVLIQNGCLLKVLKMVSILV